MLTNIQIKTEMERYFKKAQLNFEIYPPMCTQNFVAYRAEMYFNKLSLSKFGLSQVFTIGYGLKSDGKYGMYFDICLGDIAVDAQIDEYTKKSFTDSSPLPKFKLVVLKHQNGKRYMHIESNFSLTDFDEKPAICESITMVFKGLCNVSMR